MGFRVRRARGRAIGRAGRALRKCGAAALRLGIGLTLAALLATGCGEYATYSGGPQAFSTHPFRVAYPASFAPNVLPQMSPDLIVLVLLTENKPVAPNAPQAPAVITVRCYRVKPDETPQTFMERYYDNLAPSFLDIKLHQIGHDRNAPQWSVAVDKGYLAARVAVLPREKLAYDVTVVCNPKDLPRFKRAFRRALDSFRILPASG